MAHVRLLAATALLGEAAFIAANAGLPPYQGQDVVSGTISDLVHGPGGAWMEAAFVLHGIGIVGLGLLLGTPLARGALILAGAATALLAAVPTDPPGIDGAMGDVHIGLATAAFVLLPVGFAAHARAARDAGSMRWAIAAAAGVALLGAVLALPDNPAVGIVERVAAGLESAWMVRAAVRAWRHGQVSPAA